MEKPEGVLFVQPSLTITEVLGILQNPPETCITDPPQKPKAGQVFLYKADNAGKQGNIKKLHQANKCNALHVLHELDFTILQKSSYILKNYPHNR